MHGYGRFDFADGRMYEGNISEGLWHGHGKFTYSKNEYYCGEFREGRIVGKGERLFGDGSRYRGQFVDGLAHGVGCTLWPNGDIYYGHFVAGGRHGYGKMQWKDIREEYIGYWNADKATGKAMKITDWGSLERGHFVNGEKYGYITMSYLCCIMAADNYKGDSPTSAVGWGMVTCCAIPCLVCLAPTSCCSFDNLFNAAYCFNSMIPPPRYPAAETEDAYINRKLLQPLKSMHDAFYSDRDL